MSESGPEYEERVADLAPAAREERVAALAAEARRARESFEPPADPPDEERALACARDGLGDVVEVYVEARTADRPVRFGADELDQLHRATNDWLVQYATCYGVDVDPNVTVRETAELLVGTHDIRETAALLTGVPKR